MDVKTHMSSVTSDEANKLRSMAKGAGKPAAAKPAPKAQEHQSAPAKKEASRPANQGGQNNQTRDHRGNRNNNGNGNNNRHNSNNGSANANGNGGNQKRNQNNNQGGQAANRNNNNGQGQGAHWFKRVRRRTTRRRTVTRVTNACATRLLRPQPNARIGRCRTYWNTRTA